MRLIICNLLLVVSILADCQKLDTLTIFACYEQAFRNYPAAKQKDLFKDISGNKVKNIRSNWYPSLSFNGQTTYQSDVIEIPVPDLQIPGQPHDQYKLFFEVNQKIYDGGMNKSNMKIENTNFEIELQQIEIELDALKRRITRIYFLLLLSEKQHDVLSLMINELKDKSIVVESGIKNGVLLPIDKNVLKAEILKLEQKVLDVRLSRESMFKALGELTGMQLDTANIIMLPEAKIIYNTNKLRSEYELFDLQKKQIDVNNILITTANKPKLFAFSQTGYGKPGLNMLNEEFDSYYLVGLGLKWNFFNWGEIKRKEKILHSQKEIINTKQEVFEKNLNISLENEAANIKKYEESVKLDKQILQLRTEIKESSFSQLKNGIITSTDFLSELNAEMQAKLELQTHTILLQQAIFNYLTLKGEI